MSLGAKLSSDVIVTLLINLSQKVRGLVFIPLITRLLGVSAYGAFVQVEIIAQLCAKFSQLGLENALIKFAQGREGVEQSRLYVSLTVVALTVATVTAIVLAATATIVSSLFLGSPGYATLFQIGALLVPIYAAQEMGQNYYRSEMRIKRYSVLEGIKTYLNVSAVVVALLVADVGLVGLVSVVVAVELSFAIGLQTAVLRSTGLHAPRIGDLDAHLRYAVPILIGDLSGMFQDRADRLLIGFFLGAGAVGIYSISYTVARILRVYSLPLRITFFPEFSRLWEAGERREVYHYLSNGTRYLVGLAVPTIVGLYLVGEWVVDVLSTPEAAAYAPTLLPLLATGFMLIGLDSLYRQVFFADGRTVFVSVLRGGGAILNVGLNLALIPVAGVVGAALATLGTYLLLFGALVALAVRRYEIEIDLRFVVKAIVSAMGMLAIVLVTGLEHVVVLVLLCPPIYFTLLLATKAVRPVEIRFIVDTVVSPFTSLENFPRL